MLNCEIEKLNIGLNIFLSFDRKELKELERQEKEVGTQLIEEKPVTVIGTAIPPPQEDEVILYMSFYKTFQSI